MLLVLNLTVSRWPFDRDDNSSTPLTKRTLDIIELVLVRVIIIGLVVTLLTLHFIIISLYVIQI